MLPVLIILASRSITSRGRFLTGQNISIVAQQAAINTVLGAGMTFVILTGGIDLSVGIVLAASAMAALIASLIPDWGMLGIPAALLTGLLFRPDQRQSHRASAGCRPSSSRSGR